MNAYAFVPTAHTEGMDLVNDLLARDRRGDSTALVTPSGRERSYRELLTNAWKAANVLRHLGVHVDATVSVTPHKELHPLLGFLGAAQLGAVTTFSSPSTVDGIPRVGLISVGEIRDARDDASTKLICYGGPPESPEIIHWEEELWSENPAQAPATHEPDTPVIAGNSNSYSHSAVLEAGNAVKETHDVGPSTVVAVRGSLADPRIVTAGIIAPLLSGATILYPSDDPGGPDSGDIAVVDDSGGGRDAAAAVSPAAELPESRRIESSQVPL